jgi:hypothetical protein
MWIWVCGPYAPQGASEAERAENMSALDKAAYVVFAHGQTPVIGINMALPMAAAGSDIGSRDVIRGRLSALLAL